MGERPFDRIVISIKASELVAGLFQSPVSADVERIATQEWPDFDFDFGGGPMRDWILTATDHGVVVGFALVTEETIPGHVHLHQIVVEASHRGSGIGESILVAVARHALDELHAAAISLQPARGERLADRERWFGEFGFGCRDSDDELNGIWFASAERVAGGRRRGLSQESAHQETP